MTSNTSRCIRFCLFFVSIWLGACAASAVQTDLITVEGDVWARGSMPFVAYVLTTDEQNHYVLNLEDLDMSSMATPVRVRVRGVVYVDEWNAAPFAHLRVRVLETLE